MREIVDAKAEAGRIKAQDADGRLYEIVIDDRGVPHSVRTNTWIIPEGVNAGAGHVVEIMMPLDETRLQQLPLDVKVRHHDA